MASPLRRKPSDLSGKKSTTTNLKLNHAEDGLSNHGKQFREKPLELSGSNQQLGHAKGGLWDGMYRVERKVQQFGDRNRELEHVLDGLRGEVQHLQKEKRELERKNKELHEQNRGLWNHLERKGRAIEVPQHLLDSRLATRYSPGAYLAREIRSAIIMSDISTTPWYWRNIKQIVEDDALEQVNGYKHRISLCGDIFRHMKTLCAIPDGAPHITSLISEIWHATRKWDADNLLMPMIKEFILDTFIPYNNVQYIYHWGYGTIESALAIERNIRSNERDDPKLWRPLLILAPILRSAGIVNTWHTYTTEQLGGTFPTELILMVLDELLKMEKKPYTQPSLQQFSAMVLEHHKSLQQVRLERIKLMGRTSIKDLRLRSSLAKGTQTRGGNVHRFLKRVKQAARSSALEAGDPRNTGGP